MSAPIEEIEREKSNREEEEDYLRENLYPDFSYITWSCIYHLSGESVGEMTLLESAPISGFVFSVTLPPLQWWSVVEILDPLKNVRFLAAATQLGVAKRC